MSSSMEHGAMTLRAIRAIGDHGDRDFDLAPHKHADSLPAEAAPLAQILKSAALQSTIDDYNRYDKLAGQWRYTHTRWGRCGIWTAVAAIIPALATTVAAWEMTTALKVLLASLVWLLLCASWICFLYLIRRRPQEKWYSLRANAEQLRKRLFEHVMAAKSSAAANEIALLPLKLEYFRRYQYQVQRNYYRGRSEQYEKRARHADNIRKGAAVVPFVALLLTWLAAVAGFSEQGFTSRLINVIGAKLQFIEAMNIDTYGISLAIAVSALSAGLFAQAQLDDYRRNAERYRNALSRMENVMKDAEIGIDAARRAAEVEDQSTVDRLVRELHAIMSAELAEWVTIGLDGKPMQPDAEKAPGDKKYALTKGATGDATRLISHEALTPADFQAIAAATGIPILAARKVGFVSARQVSREEAVETRWNGKESSDVARPNDWIVTNMSPSREILKDNDGHTNTYVIRADAFPRLYQRDAGETPHGEVYKSRSVVEALLLPGGFEIRAPWGQMQISAVGYLIKNGDEVYGNNRDTFEATYEFREPRSGA